MRKVYRRRRLVALVVILAVIVVLALMLFSLRSTDADSSGTVQSPKQREPASQASANPEPPPSEISSPGFYPASYDIDATYTTDPRAISATQTLRYVNAEGEPMRSLHFRLWTNEDVFTERDGGTEVSRAAIGGKEVPFEVDGVDLEVKLPDPLPNGAATSVTLEFTTTVPEIAAPFGYDSGLAALGVWYPVLAVYDEGGWELSPPTDFGEPYFTEASDYDVELTLPGSLTPVATGTEKKRSSERSSERSGSGSTKTVTYEAEKVRGFALAIGENLKRASRQVGDTAVNVYYRPKSAARAQRTLSLAAESLAFYSDTYGSYPYPELDLVDAPLVAGTEYSSLALVAISGTEEYLLDAVVPHEVAHQWWYIQVGSDQFSEPWLDESLATYSEWLFSGEAATRFPRPVNPTVRLSAPVDEFPSKSTYQRVIYTYGAQVYRQLSQKIGRKTLLEGLNDYVSEHRYETATTEDLVSALSKAAGRDLTPFFEARGVTVEGDS